MGEKSRRKAANNKRGKLEMKEYRQKLYQEMEKANMISPIQCTDKEAKGFVDAPDSIPDDVFDIPAEKYSPRRFVRYPDLPIEEIQALIALSSEKSIRIIKNCVIFFTVLAVISIAAGTIGAIAAIVSLSGG